MPCLWWRLWNGRSRDLRPASTEPPIDSVVALTSLLVVSIEGNNTNELCPRHAIVEMINDFASDPSYDDIVTLGSQMTAACRESRLLMQSYSHQAQAFGKEPSLTAFHRNMVDFVLRSFLLLLHRPSARKALDDPKYYFSRKVCLDNALALISPEPDVHYARLMTVGAGFIRSMLIHSSKRRTTEYSPDVTI